MSSGYPSIPVIDDDAHGLLGAYPGKALGSIGAPGTLSIHETKNFICGESGALVLNDHALRDRAEIIRQKGTNRAQFFPGQVDKYNWVDFGSSYVLSPAVARAASGPHRAPEATEDSERVRVPFYFELSEIDQTRIVAATTSFHRS